MILGGNWEETGRKYTGRKLEGYWEDKGRNLLGGGEKEEIGRRGGK